MRDSVTSGVRSFFLLAAVCLLPVAAHALPWDVDMFKQQSFKANEMPRSPAANTVPIGPRPFTLTAEEADKTLKNPVPVGFNSVWRGKRLFQANCATCHGPKADGVSVVGPQMAVPNLLTDFYKTGRSDGRLFAVIKLGGTNMPRYGFKFSAEEQWDLVNYVRFLQGAQVPGIDRPQ